MTNMDMQALTPIMVVVAALAAEDSAELVVSVVLKIFLNHFSVAAVDAQQTQMPLDKVQIYNIH